MAVTKNHPIDNTLKKAIDYILNPEKTDDNKNCRAFGRHMQRSVPKEITVCHISLTAKSENVIIN